MATAAQQTGQIAVRDNSEIGQFTRQLESRARDIQLALPQGISAGKFQRTILTAVAQNPELLKADRGSLILACYKAAQDGLVPDGREAALVTFNSRQKIDGEWKNVKLVQYMPMVYGLRKKILQSKDANGQPVVSALQVGVVYKIEAENGYFRWERGSDPEVQHRPMLEISEDEATNDNIVAAYSIATMADGTRSCEVMRRFEINKVRQMSQTGAEGREVMFGNDKGKAIEPKGPWVDWFAEMAKKTVMRRHAKTLPMSSDVIAELGGDDDEILAARSSALTLGGTAPDAPQLIADETPHDPETGEIIEGGDNADDAAGDANGGAQKDSKPRGKAKAKETPEAGKAEPNAPAKDPAVDEQTGVTKDPNDVVAERLLGEFAAAKTELELRKLWDSSELERAPMSDELHDAVSTGYHRQERRVREAHAEPAE